MSTLNEKMTALADEVRELSGTTGSKSIDAMTTDIQDANSAIVEQANLISQISTLVQTKANPPSGGVTPTGSITIVDNGTYDVTEYAEAIVEVAGSGGSDIAVSTVRVLSLFTESQTMQIIASVYENGAITTINRVDNIYMDPELGSGSISMINNVINNTPVTLIFSQSVPPEPVATIGSATFIYNGGSTTSFIFTPDADMNMCNVILR